RADLVLDVAGRLAGLGPNPLLGDRLVGADDVEPGAAQLRQLGCLPNRLTRGVGAVGANDYAAEHLRLLSLSEVSGRGGRILTRRRNRRHGCPLVLTAKPASQSRSRSRQSGR